MGLATVHHTAVGLSKLVTYVCAAKIRAKKTPAGSGGKCVERRAAFLGGDKSVAEQPRINTSVFILGGSASLAKLGRRSEPVLSYSSFKFASYFAS